MKKILLFTLLILATSFAIAGNTKQGIKWEKNLNRGFETAEKTNQLLILNFYADWCPHCNHMEQTTYADNRVIEHLKNYIPVKIDIDKKQKLAKQYDGNSISNGGSGIPATIILDANGNQLAKTHGYRTPEELLALLDSVEAKRASITTTLQATIHEATAPEATAPKVTTP
jgi:thiol:disulfide interchange protein